MISRFRCGQGRTDACSGGAARDERHVERGEPRHQAGPRVQVQQHGRDSLADTDADGRHCLRTSLIPRQYQTSPKAMDDLRAGGSRLPNSFNGRMAVGVETSAKEENMEETEAMEALQTWVTLVT